MRLRGCVICCDKLRHVIILSIGVTNSLLVASSAVKSKKHRKWQKLVGALIAIKECLIKIWAMKKISINAQARTCNARKSN